MDTEIEFHAYVADLNAETQKLMVEQGVSDGFWEAVDPKIAASALWGGWSNAILTLEVIRVDLGDYATPADWWQALKERWLPIWIRRRWPVMLKVIDLDAVVVSPEEGPIRFVIKELHRTEFDHYEWAGGDDDAQRA